MVTITKVKRGGVFIPLSIYTPCIKIEITFSGDSSATDVSDKLLTCSIKGQKNKLKSASVAFNNLEGYWVNKISGGELISIYIDYVDGTTKRFYGKIDEKYFALTVNNGWEFTVTARQTPGFRDKKFSANYSSEQASTAIKDFIDTFYSGIVTYTNVPTITTTISLNFSNKTGPQALTEICAQISYSWYIDETNDVHLIVKDSVKNTSENIAYGVNVSACSKLGTNYKDIINRVTVYGKNIGTDVFYLQTQNNTTSQDSLWIIDSVIRDETIVSNTEASEVANANMNTTSSNDGNISVAGGIPTVIAGELMRVSIPYTEVMDWVTIEAFTHTYSARGLNTSVNIHKVESLGTIQEITNNDIASSYAGTNEYGMSEGIAMPFDDESYVESRSSTEITNGELKLTSGSSSGNMITIEQEANSSFTKASYSIDGENLDNCTVEISVNDGVSWTTLATIGATVIAGSNYKFRVNLTQITADIKPIIRAFGGYVG